MRQEINLYVGQTYKCLCPVIAMLSYLELRGINEGPLFRKSYGTPLWNMLVLQVNLTLEQPVHLTT